MTCILFEREKCDCWASHECPLLDHRVYKGRVAFFNLSTTTTTAPLLGKASNLIPSSTDYSTINFSRKLDGSRSLDIYITGMRHQNVTLWSTTHSNLKLKQTNYYLEIVFQSFFKYSATIFISMLVFVALDKN